MPARTIRKCGRALDALVTGVPQVGQKPRVTVLPESASDTKVDNSPVIVTSAVLKMTFTVEEPEPKYWQSRHQHCREPTGGALAEYLMALQMHPPVMGS